MSKRNPTSELNHDNWDQEDEKEDAGRFKTASQDVLKARQIRVAKRRAQDSEDKGTGGLFKSFTGFTGFGSSSGPANAGSAAPNSLAFNFSATTATPSSTTASTTTTAAKPATPAADPNATHLAKLRALNQSVLRWIQSHVTDSPYCVLTPVFRDYERHLADIESRHPYVESANSTTPAVTPTTNSTTPAAAAVAAAASPPKFSFSAATSSSASSSTSATATTAAATATTLTPSMPPTFSFSAQPQKPSTDGAATTATFFFGAAAKSTAASSSSSTSTTTTSTTTATTASSVAPTFTFGAGPAAPQQPGLSLFGPGGFSAAAVAAASSGSREDQEDEEYEPPKPETREIREDGAVFSQKCKLFYMAAGEAKQWKEKGVGCVHAKPAEGGSRAQLIVRADNTLGTIMLNTLVTKDMTLSVAKNNLSLACPPNPPMPKSAGDDRRIVPFLVRLKTEADAKELLAKINGLREA